MLVLIYHFNKHETHSAILDLYMQSLIHVIYTPQIQTPDFMNTGNQEQLFGRDKLMMSCPESSARSPKPRGLSLYNRTPAAAALLFGGGTCQSSQAQGGQQVG